MDWMGAAGAARVMAPNGDIANKSYRTKAAKRKAEREAALAASISRSIEDNPIVQGARTCPISDGERRAWEERTARAQRAKDAQREGRKAPAPKRASRPPPPPSKLYAAAMSCAAACDTRLEKVAVPVLQLIVALTNKGVAWPTKKWLAEKLGVCTKTIQRALASLRKWGYLGELELRKNAIGWCVGQVLRITEAVKPIFKRKGYKKRPKAPKNRGNQGGTKLSPIQIPSVSEITSSQRSPEKIDLTDHARQAGPP
jgi:hypothetical protein